MSAGDREGRLSRELGAELAAGRAAGLARRLEPPAGRDFASNDYLGLSRDPRVREAARRALETYGAGAPSARLLRGTWPCHEAAEAAAASWLGVERTLLFPSGWQANVGVVTALASRGDAIASDERNHASLIDACRLSGARIELFRHGDAAHLREVLATLAGARRRFVLVESVHSTDGDLAPLDALAEAACEADAWLIVDEAHAAGLYGEDGRGLACESELGGRLVARVVTGGKALGVGGAFVAGPSALVDTLLQRARTFVFTTAVPPPVAGALEASIGVVRTEPDRRERPHRAARRLRTALEKRGLAAGGESPIVPVLVGTPAAAVEAAGRLRARGFDARALRPPTVPPGTSRLRLVCHADHEEGELDALAASVAEVLGELALPSPPARRPAPPRSFLVAGTDTGVGKTSFAAALVLALERRTEDVRYVKLVQTGDEDDATTVARLAALPPGRATALRRFPLPASIDQAARAAGTRVAAGDLLSAVDACREASRVSTFVFEGAGGLLVPLGEREDQSDLFAHLGADVFLVARSGLGTLNHTLLSVETLRRRRMRLRAVVLVGPAHEANVRSLEPRLPVPVLSLPHLPSLSTETLGPWVEALLASGVLP